MSYRRILSDIIEEIYNDLFYTANNMVMLLYLQAAKLSTKIMVVKLTTVVIFSIGELYFRKVGSTVWIPGKAEFSRTEIIKSKENFSTWFKAKFEKYTKSKESIQTFFGTTLTTSILYIDIDIDNDDIKKAEAISASAKEDLISQKNDYEGIEKRYS
ncbi:hypothetical protein C2G38_2171562 [Gigaspora rosea]|uniref:Uncharacterized protein n=1 Tax=Gigaspora rosea TaxID=44941 RepID=A0A397VN23_9GLOM|nr:hypothetical protein C2G38_2171562 [Gigaspora rosea]